MKILLILYSLFFLILGIKHTRQIKSVADFYVAGRKRNTLELTASLFSTIFGASAIIGVAGLAAQKGIEAIWWLWSGAFFILILAILLLKKIYSISVYTLPELLEKIYSPAVRTLSSFIIVIAWVGIVAAQLVGLQRITEYTFGATSTFSVLLLGIIVIIYTTLAGQLSVIKSDLLQAILFGIAVGLLGFDLPKPSSKTLALLTNKTFFHNWYYYFIFVGLTFLIGPDIYSRIFSAKTYTVAKKSLLYTALLIFIFGGVIVYLGIYGRSLSSDPKLSFFATINSLSGNKWLYYIIMLGLFSALLSSADTVLLTSATILINDIIKPKSKIITYTRLAIVILGFLAIGLALYMQSIIGLLLYAYTLYVSAILFPALFGIMGYGKSIPPTILLIIISLGGLLGLGSKIGIGINAYVPVIFSSCAMLFSILIFHKREKRNDATIHS